MKILRMYFILALAVLDIHIANVFSQCQYGGLPDDSNSVDDNNISLPVTQITPEQEILVKEFREENIKLLTDPYLQLASPIIGFLRVKKWNKKDASKYLRKVLQWRAANNIDHLADEAIDPELLKFFPWGVGGFTKLGCPVVQAEFGQWLFDDYISSQDYVHDANKSLRRHYLKGLERARMQIKKSIPRCEKTLALIDLKNFTLQNIAHYNSFNSVVQLAVNIETYYPNFYEELIFINSSEEFKNFFNSVKHYLPLTTNIMTFYLEAESELAKKHILSIVDPDQLQSRYFGNKHA